jgi:hypothetical protein
LRRFDTVLASLEVDIHENETKRRALHESERLVACTGDSHHGKTRSVQLVPKILSKNELVLHQKDRSLVRHEEHPLSPSLYRNRYCGENTRKKTGGSSERCKRPPRTPSFPTLIFPNLFNFHNTLAKERTAVSTFFRKPFSKAAGTAGTFRNALEQEKEVSGFLFRRALHRENPADRTNPHRITRTFRFRKKNCGTENALREQKTSPGNPRSALVKNLNTKTLD